MGQVTSPEAAPAWSSSSFGQPGAGAQQADNSSNCLQAGSMESYADERAALSHLRVQNVRCLFMG